MPLSQETVLQTHPWNVAMHYAWLRNTGVLTGARNRGGGEKVPTHATVCCVDVKPDAPRLGLEEITQA